MSGGKWTPGPWEEWSEEGENAAGRFRHSVCRHVGAQDSENHTCVAEAFGATWNEAFWNATLIAAAPELVEALEEAKAALSYAMRGTSDAEQSDKFAATIAKIDATLAKAGAL